MPSFYVDDVDIDVDEFLSACSKSEKERLVEYLAEDGYVLKNQLESSERMSAAEEIFEDHLLALRGKWNLLTNEEEETIIKIAKKFLYL